MFIKYFWILSCITLTACASYQSIDLKLHEFLNPLPVKIKQQVTFSYFSPSFGCGWLGDDQPLFLSQTDGRSAPKDVSEWKKSICQDGVALKRYEFTIRGIVPPTPAGTLVTDSADATARWQAQMEEAAQNFFLANMDRPLQKKLERRYTCPVLNYYVLASKDAKQFEQDQKERMYQSLSKDLRASSMAFMFVRMPNDKRFFLVERSAIAQGTRESGADLRTAIPNLNTNAIFVAADTTTASSVKRDLALPLGLAYLGDLEIMANDFVLVPGGEIDVKQAVQNRHNDFKEYIKRNTRVEENQTDDPSVIDFKVALDLQPFCQSARPVSDFITK
jgi:hypothetical protein